MINIRRMETLVSMLINYYSVVINFTFVTENRYFNCVSLSIRFILLGISISEKEEQRETQCTTMKTEIRK